MFSKCSIVENDGELILMALHAHFLPQQQYSRVYALFLAFHTLVYRWGCQFLALFSQDNEHTKLTVLLFFQNPFGIFAHIKQHYHDFQSNVAIFPSVVQAYTQPYFVQWKAPVSFTFLQDNEHTELTVLFFFQNPYAIFAHILQHYHDFQSNVAVFPSVVQAYTQPYSFSVRIKLIICQIRHELSVTIHEISTGWKKNDRWWTLYMPNSKNQKMAYGPK